VLLSLLEASILPIPRLSTTLILRTSIYECGTHGGIVPRAPLLVRCRVVVELVNEVYQICSLFAEDFESVPILPGNTY
jgi:hypothetical protein